MHFCCAILSEGQLTDEKIQSIMKPYNEQDFYDKYENDEDGELMHDIPPEDYPEFLWDYYKIDDAGPVDYGFLRTGASVVIDRHKTAVAYEKWNGRNFIKQDLDILEFIQRCQKDPKHKWMTVIDYHI